MELGLEDRLDIQQLIARLSLALDTHDVDSFVHAFAPDGVLTTASGVYQGRPELLAHAVARKRQLDQQSHTSVQHRVTNIVLDGRDQSAHAICYLEKVGRTRTDGRPELLMIGWYEDWFSKHDGVWRIDRRSVLDTLPIGKATH